MNLGMASSRDRRPAPFCAFTAAAATRLVRPGREGAGEAPRRARRTLKGKRARDRRALLANWRPRWSPQLATRTRQDGSAVAALFGGRVRRLLLGHAPELEALAIDCLFDRAARQVM